jgi:hypothetical protein
LQPANAKTGELETRAGTPHETKQITQNIYNMNITVYQTGSASTLQEIGYKPVVAYTQEAAKTGVLITLLDEMKEVLDEPTEFEQIRAAFLGELRTMEARKHARETYFTDLLTMIDIGIAYTDGSNLNQDSFTIFKEAVRNISQEVTAADLKELRQRFREAGINILKPLIPTDSVKDLFKEVFGEPSA